MLTIPLTPYESGELTKVDTADFWDLADFEWSFVGGYAARSMRSDSGASLVYMHRQIMGLGSNAAEYVDHVNGDKLDNRRKNLRLCSQSANRQNSMKARHIGGAAPSSRFKGVTREGRPDRGGLRWHATIRAQGRTRSLGRFASETEAAQAYDEAARAEFGAFARLNFPRDGEQGALRSA